MKLTPREELFSRIGNLQRLMQMAKLDGALITQNIDLFYFSGTAQTGYMYIPVEGEPILLVKKSLSRAKVESTLGRIDALGSLKKLPEQLQSYGYDIKGKIGLEMDVLPTSIYLFLQQVFSESDFLDISKLIKTVRQVKSAWEIDCLRRGGQVLKEVYDLLPQLITEGMTEIALASKMEAMLRERGHMGALRMRAFNQEVFMGHLMTGATAAQPSFFDGPTGGYGLTPAWPQSAGEKRISRNEPILVDYSGVFDGYIVDKTRIFCLGKVSQDLAYAHHIALNIQQQVITAAKTGAVCEELYQLGVSIADKAGLVENFMGVAPDQAKFIGHGVGLELDEWPILAPGMKEDLSPGMVFAIEPKFVFPELGVVGIENTFVLLEDQTECLTPGQEEIVCI